MALSPLIINDRVSMSSNLTQQVQHLVGNVSPVDFLVFRVTDDVLEEVVLFNILIVLVVRGRHGVFLLDCQKVRQHWYNVRIEFSCE